MYIRFICLWWSDHPLYLSFLILDSTMRMDPLLQGLRRLSLVINPGGKKRCWVNSRFQKQTSFRHLPKTIQAKAALNTTKQCSALFALWRLCYRIISRKRFCLFLFSFLIVVHFLLKWWYVKQSELNALMCHFGGALSTKICETSKTQIMVFDLHAKIN